MQRLDRNSLEEILASPKSFAREGKVFRVVLNDYPPDRENTFGARWNPPDLAAIYCCLDSAVCIAGVEYGLARQSRPVKADLRRTLYRIEVAVAAVMDLSAILPKLEAIGIGCDGLIVPSARKTGNNLVVYPCRTGDSYRFDVIDQKHL
jgi:RES domain-containing protein